MSEPTPAQPAESRRNELRIAYRAPGGGVNVITFAESQQRRARAREVGERPGVELKPTAPEVSEEPQGKKKRAAAADSWLEIRKKLRTWDQPRLLGLIQDLCSAMPEVRVAIAGRLAPASTGKAKATTGLDKLQKEIRVLLRGRGHLPKDMPRIAEAKKIADRYHAASADADGAITLHAELMMVLMELACEFGGTNDREADAIFSAAGRVVKLLPEATDLSRLSALNDRMKRVLRDRNLPGYGLDDVIADVAEAIDERLRAG